MCSSLGEPMMTSTTAPPNAPVMTRPARNTATLMPIRTLVTMPAWPRIVPPSAVRV